MGAGWQVDVNHWGETVRSKVAGSAGNPVELVSGDVGVQMSARFRRKFGVFRVFAHGPQALVSGDVGVQMWVRVRGKFGEKRNRLNELGGEQMANTMSVGKVEKIGLKGLAP